MRASIALSKLRPSRKNPRWVKPKAEAQQRLVASVRTFGLLEPLVVRPMPGQRGEFQVIAGNRRLSALRQVHRQSKDDPKINCEVRDVDDSTADALSLSENFAREAMHPLDEAEAFAKLAAEQAKGAEAIASHFGVTERYVKQRMKLAGLAEVVKTAFREEKIDTGTAEAFAAVPEDRQLAIWEELNGTPRNAQQVRTIIATAWIDARHALFDVSALPDAVVSRDLFSDQILVERAAFMEAQSQALAKERDALREDGWSNVVTGPQDQVQDQLYAMSLPEPEVDEKTHKELAKIESRREKLEADLEKAGDDQDAIRALEHKAAELDARAEEVVEAAPKVFGESTKAVGTAFLILDPDGQVRREHRVPKHDARRSAGGNGGQNGQPEAPTADRLSDKQLADTFTHQVMAVREALLKAPAARKRILAMILHDKVRSDALSVRRLPNDSTMHATQTEGFASGAFTRLCEKRTELDPLAQNGFLDDAGVYARLGELSDARLGQLIDLLVVECLTAHLQHRTELVHRLSQELKVQFRKSWRPDAVWLAGYQKIQLAQLMAELHGSTYDAANEGRKKTELVEALAKLFADAADGTLDDKQLAERANTWLPANLREVKQETADESKVVVSARS